MGNVAGSAVTGRRGAAALPGYGRLEGRVPVVYPPNLEKRAAEYLMEAGAALVGIDSLNIDDTEDGKRPVHTALLDANIPITEHLCSLDRLPDRGCRFFAVPVKVKGFGTFPVRAFAMIER